MRSYILNLTKKELQKFALEMSDELGEYHKICLKVKQYYPDVHAELIAEEEE